MIANYISIIFIKITTSKEHVSKIIATLNHEFVCFVLCKPKTSGYGMVKSNLAPRLLLQECQTGHVSDDDNP